MKNLKNESTQRQGEKIVCLILTQDIAKANCSRYIFIQSQQWKHQSNV